MLFLRRTSPLNLLHHRHRHRRHSFSSKCPDPSDLWISKVVSTLFLLSPFRLTSLRHAITPSVAAASLRRLRDGHASFSSADLLLASCVRAGDPDASLCVFSAAADLELRVGSYALNNLLSLLIARNRTKDAILTFERHSRSRLFASDTCTFNIVIKGCVRIGDADRAFRFFVQMREFGCSPDTITHNVLIDGLCKSGYVDRGRKLLRGIQSDSSCAPNVVSFTSVMVGYCKSGKMEDAYELFEEMLLSGIRPSRVSYNVLIDGYGKVGDMKMAISMYERMMMCGCEPDVVTFTSLIDGYCRSGQLDEAMGVWDEMGRRRIRPNVYTFGVVINSLCKKNRLSEARILLKELNAREDIVACAFVYNPVIDGFCKAGDLEEANLVMAEMEGRGCSPDKFTYTILIIGHCMKGRMTEAIDLFNRMVATGCAPDSITVTSLVSCLLKAGMPGEANRIVIVTSGKDLGLNPSTMKEILSTLMKSVDVPVAM